MNQFSGWDEIKVHRYISSVVEIEVHKRISSVDQI